MRLTEPIAREQTRCACCGRAKEPGLVVCWNCFKYETPTGFVPLKESGLDFADWLAKAKG